MGFGLGIPVVGETCNLEQDAKTWITVSKQTNNWLVVSTYPCEK
jgi:hypothetical protein